MISARWEGGLNNRCLILKLQHCNLQNKEGAHSDGTLVPIVFYYHPGDLVCLRQHASEGEQ